MQKHSSQFSVPLIIFAVINVVMFGGIFVTYYDLLFPIIEASLLTRLCQPRQASIGGSR